MMMIEVVFDANYNVTIIVVKTTIAKFQVRGKYGYYDPEGILREATYGATKVKMILTTVTMALGL